MAVTKLSGCEVAREMSFFMQPTFRSEVVAGFLRPSKGAPGIGSVRQ